MLHYDAYRQLCHDRTQRRLSDAHAERLALHARSSRQRRRRQLARAAGLDLLLRARRHTAGHGAGA